MNQRDQAKFKGFLKGIAGVVLFAVVTVVLVLLLEQVKGRTVPDGDRSERLSIPRRSATA